MTPAAAFTIRPWLADDGVPQEAVEWIHSSTLLSALLRQYPGTWFLEVRESNAAARALYDDLGFELRGRRTRYYSDPDEDGLVMAAVAASTCI